MGVGTLISETTVNRASTLRQRVQTPCRRGRLGWPLEREGQCFRGERTRGKIKK